MSKEKLIKIRNKIYENKYMLVNTSDLLYDDNNNCYNEVEYQKMRVPVDYAADIMLNYFSEVIQSSDVTNINKIDLEFDICMIPITTSYKSQLRDKYEYKKEIAISPWAFIDLGSNAERIILEGNCFNKKYDETSKRPCIIVNYEEFFEEMKERGYDFGASTFDDLLTRFKSLDSISSIWDDKILNPICSIYYDKEEKKLI